MKKINKFLSLLFCAVLIVSSIGTANTAAAREVNPTAAFGNAYGMDGSYFMIPITVSGNTGIMGCGFRVSYDPDALVPTSASCGISDGMFNDSIATSMPGSFDLYWCNTENSSYNGNLFILEFSVLESVTQGTTHLELSYYQDDTFDENYNDVAFECVGKDISITDLGISETHTDRCELLGHTYEETIINPTCISPGLIIETCKFCGDIYQIPGDEKTGHSYIDEIVQATCTTDGYTVHTCSVCGDSYVDGNTDKTGHAFVLTGQDEDGKYYRCNNCGETKTDKFYSEQLSIALKEISTDSDSMQITVPISVGNNTGFMGLGLKVSYDPKILQPVSVFSLESFSDGLLSYSTAEDGENHFDIFWSSEKEFTANSDILQMVFDIVSEDTNTTEITIEPYDEDIFDENWQMVDTICTGIAIDTVRFADVNGDNAVNILDLVRFKKHFALIGDCSLAADIDQNGKVDTSDMALLKKGLLGSFSLIGPNSVAKHITDVDLQSIADKMKNISSEITVAGQGVLSDNNPFLPDEICGFPVKWTVSNSDNYEIVEHSLSVKNYDNINNESLTLTAEITANGKTVSRSFGVSVAVLRMNEKYLKVYSDGFSRWLKRGSSFSYTPQIISAPTEGFSKPVMPVTSDAVVICSAEDSLGNKIEKQNVFFENEGKYSVQSTAPLNSQGKMSFFFGYYLNDEFICDYSFEQSFYVSETIYSVSYVLNGGSAVRISDGSSLIEEAYPEESIMFKDLKFVRNGYSFDGLYCDEAFETLFYNPSGEDIKMPSQNIVLYAKWTPKLFKVMFDPGEGSCEILSIDALCDVALGDLPTPTRTGYNFDGWYTSEGLKITSESAFTAENDVQLVARWNAQQYKVSFDANGGTVNETSRNTAYDSEYGELPVPNRAGYTFDGWYTEKTGGEKIEAASVFRMLGDQALFAHWTVITYYISWSNGTGYTISVTRTASPNVGASEGALANGDEIYLGDQLVISYNNATGYSVVTHGVTEITVSGDITSSSVYATAVANDYTYTVNYKSSNGVSLGSTTVTHTYGTTHTITPISYSGYTTPSAQSVVWDSVTAKTITFIYTPKAVSSTQSVGSGSWWYYTSTSGITYSVSAEFKNRTATTIQARLVWTNTIKNAAYGYRQAYTATIGGVSTGEVQIASSSTWRPSNGYGQNGNSTGYSPWVTISVSAKTTSVYISANWYDATRSGSCSNTVSIPTY